MDVGARGAPPPELDSLGPLVRRIGFEPDPDECERLNIEGGGEFFAIFLSDTATPKTLHLYREIGYSSSMALSSRYQQLWSGPVPVEKSLTVEATTLDSFVASHPDLSPDILKLDTQGSELSILQGAERSLESVAMVEVEVEFSAIYEDQPLYEDIASYLTGLGFELLYLNRAFVNRRQVYRGPSRGQVLFADALFGRREDQLDSWSPEQVAKYIILLIQYGHIDIAFQLVDAFPAVESVVPGIRGIFRNAPHPVVQGLLMQVDKLLAVALHARRYNQRTTDSDRAWPIR